MKYEHLVVVVSSEFPVTVDTSVILQKFPNDPQRNISRIMSNEVDHRRSH